jgi:histidinol-phosphatase
MATFSRELDLGCEIARQAGDGVLRYWRQGLAFESKSDDSPVTIADRESEQLITRLIAEHFPGDGMLGEEGANEASRTGRRWIIDPLDGTRDFVRGNSAWAVLLGFEADGEMAAGFAYLPAMGDMFCAVRGGGAFCNESAIHVSGISSVSQAVLCINELHGMTNYPFAGRLLDWMQQFWAVRSMGGCLDAVMVARGQADLWIEPSAAPWDLAPFKVIVEEAGGRFFNMDGGSSIYGGSCVITTPGLEEEARRFVGAVS